ncbi:hypothetical protein N7539_003407 [Penicillium diatomitis]|uniref:Ion transport domain-containing protein n=1 Tax=Penicillium diatomitis TaxID=2819901 RepID=A0A9X0BXU2_9EURO|nr:uncharacterized protein N7539_003407 [Penicillium diatomitis]KAJ5488517.1 hypothetical protein N7539_003407 [Penicillium diatomitis]
MLASLLRPKVRRSPFEENPSTHSPTAVPSDNSPWIRSAAHRNGPHARRARKHKDNSAPGLGNIDEEMVHDWEDQDDEDEDEHDVEENGLLESAPLLPRFSTSDLDSVPVYDLTHAIRPLIVSRCETTLTWEQLRSPQVSQFLVKPIQQKIMSAHFSRATLYALMANCLQFGKEIQLNLGNSGASQTRAMVSELLAIKLLKEYDTRELIDALSYEFYPLQGQDPTRNWATGTQGKREASTSRVSCLEVAIRAQAKRFLSHPVVVQQLEAIWAGTIVFHSASDSLHRRNHQRGMHHHGRYYGTATDRQDDQATSSGTQTFRRSVTLYNPRDASLFKLSRLRVPRYRQFLSTLSFAVLLGLFLAVLQQRSRQITSLEVVFWFWSAGFLLDEIVGFNEQGFSLYLMSFWNVFDLGILLLLVCYYCLRIYGAFLTYPRNRQFANQAYDVLAANAVLLFPRLFSILDHYRYFSQLLIAFRIMASDLIAVFVLIVVACSGFFVAFLSFGSENSPNTVAYALFQMLMGFTPTAWAMWTEYNALGKTILTIFLFICHFVVVTILITVLTNSFMRIVQNADQEHQFLFAVNTISMVKSDALFSYVAPTNIIGWLLTPLRYLMPFTQFIRLNRTIIKITHLPVLFTICFYEKLILSPRVIEPIDLIDVPANSEAEHMQRWRPNRLRAFSNRPRLVREPSFTTHNKDQTLDEVFRQPYGDSGSRDRPQNVRDHQKSTVIKDWMQDIGSGAAQTPDEQDSTAGDMLEMPVRRLRFPFRGALAHPGRNFTETTRSVASNPEDRMSRIESPVFNRRGRNSASPSRLRQPSHHTDMEGDDELTSDDDNESQTKNSANGSASGSEDASKRVDNSEKTTPQFFSSRPSTARVSRRSSPMRRPRHSRTVSGATMLYNPIQSPRMGSEKNMNQHRNESAFSDETDRLQFMSTSVDQGLVERSAISRNTSFAAMSVPETEGLYSMDQPASKGRQPPLLFDLGSDLGDNKAVVGAFAGPVPSSFNTQLAFATGGLRREGSSQSQTQDMLSKLVLARMNNIEEGFREVIKEVKDLRLAGSSRSRSHSGTRVKESRPLNRERKKTGERRDFKKRRPTSSGNNSAGREGEVEEKDSAGK